MWGARSRLWAPEMLVESLEKGLSMRGKLDEGQKKEVATITMILNEEGAWLHFFL